MHKENICKCGRNMIDDTCEGCGLDYNNCDCEAIEIPDIVPKREMEEEPLLR